MGHGTSQLGRPREFEEAEALAQATSAFWSLGYAGTSYAVLENATGLHRQSLRYAFGDKAALFERVVSDYTDKKVGHVVERLRRPGPALANIRAVFEIWAADADHPSRRGCLMVNAMAELGATDGAAVRAIERANDRLIAGFESAFAAARRAGEVRAELDPHVLAVQALTLGDGLMLQSRSGAAGRVARQVFDAFLDQIAA